MEQEKLNELRRKANEVIGDSEIQEISEVVNILESKFAKDKEAQDRLQEIQKKIEKGQTEQKEIIRQLIGVVERLKVNLPDIFKAYIVNQKSFPKAITIDNLKEIEPLSEVKLKKPEWYKSFSKQELLEILIQVLDRGIDVRLLDDFRDPRKPLSVRLSDGKKFYEAIIQAVGGGVSAGVDDKYPSGTGSNGSVTLTNADTAYSLWGTPPTKKVVLILYNGTANDAYWGYENSNSNGILLPPDGRATLNLGANTNLYLYSDTAGTVITYTQILVS